MKCNKIYYLKAATEDVNESLNQIGKLYGEHPVILIPKPQSKFQKNKRKGRTYYAIVGTSKSHRDISKYLFKKTLKDETYFFSSQIREISEKGIGGEYKCKDNNITHKEYKKCYNIVKDYILDVENQGIEEYYEELYYSMGETMTEERRQEIGEKIQKQEPIRFTIERLEKSNKKLQKSNKELQESNKELQESNKELQETTHEFKYMFLKEREENGAYLTAKQINFLKKYKEKYD